jgi:hypothetical protein
VALCVSRKRGQEVRHSSAWPRVRDLRGRRALGYIPTASPCAPPRASCARALSKNRPCYPPFWRFSPGAARRVPMRRRTRVRATGEPWASILSRAAPPRPRPPDARHRRFGRCGGGGFGRNRIILVFAKRGLPGGAWAASAGGKRRSERAAFTRSRPSQRACPPTPGTAALATAARPGGTFGSRLLPDPFYI